MEIFNSKEEFAEWYLRFFESEYLNEAYENYLLSLQQQSLCRLNQGDTFLDEGKEWISLLVSHNDLLGNPYLNADSEGYYLFSNYGKMMEPYCLLFL